MVAGAEFAHALDPTRTLDQYSHTVWNPSDGLAAGAINAISQTTDGYLWIGTDAGIVRFDGQAFQRLDSAQDEFGPPRILGLNADANGGLWIRSLDPSLFRYQNAKLAISRPTSSHDPHVTAMTPSRKGGMVFATKSDGLVGWDGGAFRTIIGGSVLTGSPITSIAEMPSGDLWLGTVDSGILLVHDAKIVRLVGGLPSLRVTCLLADAHGQVYVGTDRGLVRWNGSSLTAERVPQALRNLSIRAILSDRDGNLWMGSDRGLIRLDHQGTTAFPQSGSGRAITALFEDREGDIWTGSAGQLERIRETPFIAWHPAAPVAQDSGGGPVHADHRGDVWFASVPGVIGRVSGGALTEYRLPALRNDLIYSIAGDAEQLWVGLQRGGLARVMFTHGGATLKSYPQLKPVYVVHQSRDHSVWMGTVGGGATHSQNGEFRTWQAADGLASNVVFSISESPDGSIWFGTPSGLSRFSQNQWRTYRVQDGLPSANVNSTFVDSDGIVWVATVNGLAFIRSGRVYAVSLESAPLLRSPVFGIAEDHSGALWVVTSEAILRMDRARLLSATLSSADVREFGLLDGLSAVQGVRRSPTISIDPSGVIWISRAGGVVSIDPERVRRTAAATIVHVSQLLVDGNEQNARPSPSFPWDIRRVAIRYEGLNLASPERIRYRFKLDGFDSNWNESGTSREAAYTNLKPGSYLFHVLASNADRTWGGAEATLSFTVVPAYWQMLWFRAACVSAAIILAIAGYRLRIHYLTEQVKLQFEVRFAERNRIARDLHDTLLQSFQGLLLRFQAVENMLPGNPLQARKSLETAISYAARAITEGRDAVQELRRDESGTALIDTLTSLGEELRLTDNEGSPSYRVLLEGTPRQLHPGLQDDLYRISREAVANAFRHAHATSIELDIRYDPRMLRLRIRDDGIGMDRDILASGGREGHWGLPGMQERARAMKGNLEIWSEQNRGTEIELTVPANIAYMRMQQGEAAKLTGENE
jgi:ligand-binding sensor domain-containing protein/signal transduction histidine kinase